MLINNSTFYHTVFTQDVSVETTQVANAAKAYLADRSNYLEWLN